MFHLRKKVSVRRLNDVDPQTSIVNVTFKLEIGLCSESEIGSVL